MFPSPCSDFQHRVVPVLNTKPARGAEDHSQNHTLVFCLFPCIQICLDSLLSCMILLNMDDEIPKTLCWKTLLFNCWTICPCSFTSLWTRHHPYFWKTRPLRDVLFISSHVTSWLPVNLICCSIKRFSLALHNFLQFFVTLVKNFAGIKLEIRIEFFENKGFSLTFDVFERFAIHCMLSLRKGLWVIPWKCYAHKLLPWTFHQITRYFGTQLLIIWSDDCRG